MLLILAFLLLTSIVWVLPGRYKRYFSFGVSLYLAAHSSFFAYQAFTHNQIEQPIGYFGLLGDIDLKVDYLSAVFIIMINFVVLASSLYSIGYLKKLTHDAMALNLHLTAFSVLHASMLLLCMFDNILAFMIFWEIMSFSSFVLLIFDYQRTKNIRAAVNYLVQMHIGAVFLMVATIIVGKNTDHYSFSELHRYFHHHPNYWVFLLYFIGFSFKISFFPFHTWAPEAYSVAPPHAAAIMSGVMKKLGFYGLIRVLMHVSNDHMQIGFTIVLVGLVTALYGIINSILQKDLKKTLAFSSIENVGIIAIGIGTSYIGYSIEDYALTFLGMAGALLHILNHALFKSLLFLSAGSVEYATGTSNINRLGGLLGKMPSTGLFFLIGSLSICGLPPFNGFISEFLIYNGIFEGLNSSKLMADVLLLITLLVFCLIGGLSIYNYTKAFGLTFLGTQRDLSINRSSDKINWMMNMAQVILVLGIFSVDLVPSVYLTTINHVITSFTRQGDEFSLDFFKATENLGYVSLIFLGLIFAVGILRFWLVQKNTYTYNSTWGCGYVGSATNMQYTSTSYSEYFVELSKPIVHVKKSMDHIPALDIFPKDRDFNQKSKDLFYAKVLKRIIVMLFRNLRKLAIIQTGQTQSYIMYAFLFMIVLMLLTVLNFI